MSLRIATAAGELEPLQVSIAQAARLLGYSPRTIQRLIAASELDAVGERKLRRVSLASIKAYVERHQGEKGAA